MTSYVKTIIKFIILGTWITGRIKYAQLLKTNIMFLSLLFFGVMSLNLPPFYHQTVVLVYALWRTSLLSWRNWLDIAIPCNSSRWDRVLKLAYWVSIGIRINLIKPLSYLGSMLGNWSVQRLECILWRNCVLNRRTWKPWLITTNWRW